MENQQNKTFQNLQVLEASRQAVQEDLGKKYFEKVEPFVKIILTIMKAQNIDKFTAMKVIKDRLPIYNKPNAPLYFSAALMEIVEENHFKEIKN